MYTVTMSYVQIYMEMLQVVPQSRHTAQAVFAHDDSTQRDAHDICALQSLISFEGSDCVHAPARPYQFTKTWRLRADELTQFAEGGASAQFCQSADAVAPAPCAA